MVFFFLVHCCSGFFLYSSIQEAVSENPRMVTHNVITLCNSSSESLGLSMSTHNIDQWNWTSSSSVIPIISASLRDEGFFKCRGRSCLVCSSNWMVVTVAIWEVHSVHALEQLLIKGENVVYVGRGLFHPRGVSAPSGISIYPYPGGGSHSFLSHLGCIIIISFIRSRLSYGAILTCMAHNTTVLESEAKWWLVPLWTLLPHIASKHLYTKYPPSVIPLICYIIWSLIHYIHVDTLSWEVRTDLYHSTSSNCIVKLLQVQVLKVNCVFNNCAIAIRIIKIK